MHSRHLSQRNEESHSYNNLYMKFYTSFMGNRKKQTKHVSFIRWAAKSCHGARLSRWKGMTHDGTLEGPPENHAEYGNHRDGTLCKPTHRIVVKWQNHRNGNADFQGLRRRWKEVSVVMNGNRRNCHDGSMRGMTLNYSSLLGDMCKGPWLSLYYFFTTAWESTTVSR